MRNKILVFMLGFGAANCVVEEAGILMQNDPNIANHMSAGRDLDEERLNIMSNPAKEVTIFYTSIESVGHDNRDVIPASVVIKSLEYNPNYCYTLRPRNEEPVNYSDLKLTVSAARYHDQDISQLFESLKEQGVTNWDPDTFQLFEQLKRKYPQHGWYLASRLKI